ncbi:hypothetical protein D7V97_06180 [Corallococcus sp. CA053C]|uniref:YtxH domain-containing protein n=1 Tax=Corallococcus sicarius TaxID=2316726 RepID=A0A3A8NR50_9BACT|nr:MULTISPECIES: YtxH domain-containing protein [Corallococcus]RKH13239.1 hypothetical protein D7V97_06180 [Corallococcus sp. CA053C]RKH44651.1 hypothetical protein D7X12_09925 [Corallococcus sicarius]
MLSLKDLKKLDRDDLLDLVGLETRRTTAETTLPALGIFAAGLLVGVGVGLLMADKPGQQLRGDLRTKLQGGQDKLVGAINSARGTETQTAATGSTVPPGSRTT